jgi:hypothetical protein
MKEKIHSLSNDLNALKLELEEEEILLEKVRNKLKEEQFQVNIEQVSK